MSNVHKSDDGWVRFRERTDSGAKAHRADMYRKPKSASLSPTNAPPATPPSTRAKLRRMRRVVAPNGRTF
jgi:hypothetical protein